MKIGITGHSGLLGEAIIRSNECLWPYSNEILKSHKADLRYEDLKFDETPDIVIHCASKVGGIKANINKGQQFYEDNTLINRTVLDWCHKNRTKLVTVLSTCIYPDADFMLKNCEMTSMNNHEIRDFNCSEHEKYVAWIGKEENIHAGPPPVTNAGYAYSKRKLHVEADALTSVYGIPTLQVVPNNLFGANDNFDIENSHVIPAMIHKIFLAKEKNEMSVSFFGTGHEIREFTYANDAADRILWLIRNSAVGTYNIGNTEPITMHSLAMSIKRILGYKGSIIFTGEMSGQLAKPTSSKKLIQAGYVFEQFNFENRLEFVCNQFLKDYPNVRGIK